jgi:hypothetical protein
LIGFAFYDGLIVSVVFIVLMTLLFWPAGPGLHGITQTLTVHARAWLCYGIPVALELGWRFAHPGLYVTGGSATTSQVLGFVGLSWTQTLIPLTFGPDVWVFSTHAERMFAGLLGQVLFIGFVVGSIIRRRSAWRAWVLLGSTFLVGAALVGATRAGTYGPGAASDVKYVALDAFFLVIAVGFALLPVRPLAHGHTTLAAPVESAGDPSAGHRRGARPVWFRGLVVLTLLAVVVVYGMALVFDQDRNSESTTSHASRAFFSNFSDSWTSSGAGAGHAFLWDTEINPRIVTHKFFPFDTASVTVGRLHPDIWFDKWGGRGYLIRSDGGVVPATAATQARGLTDERTTCANPQKRTGRIVVALDHRLNAAKRWFGLISYRSATGAVATQSDGTTVVLPKGSGTLLTAFPPAPLGSAVWNLRSGGRTCITGFEVVLPEPVGTR